ncbi:NifX-associated nitrogen fixation protein [Thalassolituus sp.]|jgi:probable nitrogen fixation protein|uniref:NifX-associated nitrogen fixation protein n=1 Tax=Thalassolituus sp. TaxID=2030822 RepID=UPI002A805E1D|nr:NifX-associated nitrogen fixation protein [Thalassolituus sp.]|tara:strand:- start:13162 stop:13629 length:468 start_codon:yes stop_codon:yes gene_type:complete
MTDALIKSSDELLSNPLVRQLVVQLRAQDSYGTYDTWSDDRVIDPMILSKERRREIPVVGDPDETTISRVKAYYNAVSTTIEKECGLMATPVINISHEGFGRAMVIVGKLVVLDKVLRDVHRFGFDSLEKLVEEIEKVSSKAVELINAHGDVARL